MSFVVHTAGTGRKAFGIAAGLRWVVIEASSGKPGKKPRAVKGNSKLIRTQGQRIGASRYVRNPISPEICGFYNDPIGSGATGTNSNVYSLSALFLKSLQETELEGHSSILLLQPSALLDKRVIVVIEDGSIVTDMVTDQVQAIEQVKDRLDKFPDSRFFSQLDETGHQHITISWDDMAEMVTSKDKSALLRVLPRSPWMPLVACIGIVSIAGLVAYQKLELEPAAKRKAILEAQKSDKSPEYLANADRELSQAGWDRANFSEFMNGLKKEPVFLKGWKLESIQGDRQQLRYSWKRHGGTVDELMKALPNAKVNYQDSTLDSTIMLRKHESKSNSWAREKITSPQAALEIIRPKLQFLANAGIGSTTTDATRWTELGIDGVSQDVILSKFTVEVETPFHKVSEVVNLMPENIFIKSFEITVSDNDLRMKLKGNVYVK